ncbi:EAL domain-containing protein [Methylocystis sp. MJC1]|jgi:two-component system CheB/CheR fusion protein|uniref:putative bifunctional diguanylate cyclase/phosphodiesterase n=1 Tax=Methylocystis sp. MJC1 TaxID=2654282 RepID=UPI0013EB8869|nr:EAL domain-containing protein [Methylocystis sp. MJC1]KAF2992845.1 Cyclic di-GMP phosphodiesterase Gmr [Methylocystis sp. MJC1]MBU6526804.1 EAL domain-containing protein [Methylocystis sp. MJC1]UZX13238.1 EAL domain-containing protein [Methylocystis sp. MJC1]
MIEDDRDADFGRGLNSIPIRFCLMSMVVSGACALGLTYLLLHAVGPQPDWAVIGLAIAETAALPAMITYAAASRLAGTIVALRESADAIAAGDVNSPVEIDCACEVGGLAKSFHKMVERLNANIRRMNTLAHSDAVTGLPNRAAINHVLSLGAKLSGEPGACRGSLFFIDLDGFKSINDTFGHEIGDELLRAVSRRVAAEAFHRRFEDLATCMTAFGELCDTCPEDIVFARFAGDEFIALVPEVNDPAHVEHIARTIVASLARPFEIEGHKIQIGASVGVARAPQDATNPHELLRLADIAMYAAKQKGKNNYVRFEPALRSSAVERNELEYELREAIESDALTMYFQPKVESARLSVAGVEALLRWNHPIRGMVPPGKFIPIAEQAGLMPELGTAVLNLALRQCRKWADQGMRIPVAINVSPAQFDDPLFVPGLISLLRHHGVDPGLIEVEITETMVMTDFDTAAARVAALRDAGLAISIDDFGVGFSNLSQLAKLPVNFLKIDRSLTEAVASDQKAQAIVRATISMAHALGHATIAEGIETDEQAAFLRLAGCDKMQGFLFARPMPADELERWLAVRDGKALPAQHIQSRRTVSAA